MNTLGVKRGSSAPLGATVYSGGINFGVFYNMLSAIIVIGAYSAGKVDG
ncbi:MAG: hypothetical protein ACLP51_01715 [Syntrophobacteraceae bacterium]